MILNTSGSQCLYVCIAILLPHHQLYTDISKLFWFNLDALADEHFEPHKRLATFQIVVVVVECVHVCVFIQRYWGS